MGAHLYRLNFHGGFNIRAIKTSAYPKILAVSNVLSKVSNASSGKLTQGLSNKRPKLVCHCFVKLGRQQEAFLTSTLG